MLTEPQNVQEQIYGHMSAGIEKFACLTIFGYITWGNMIGPLFGCRPYTLDPSTFNCIWQNFGLHGIFISKSLLDQTVLLYVWGKIPDIHNFSLENCQFLHSKKIVYWKELQTKFF